MKEKIKAYMLIYFSTVLTALAISVFFVPNKIVNGGASGLSTVIYYTVGLKPSLANAIINIVLLIFAFICFGIVYEHTETDADLRTERK